MYVTIITIIVLVKNNFFEVTKIKMSSPGLEPIVKRLFA